MNVMLAYDHSRNARIALEGVMKLFAAEKPEITLISVIEEPGSATDAGDDMFKVTVPATPPLSDTWLKKWEPENAAFWKAGGSVRAWTTLTITTLNLTMAFIVWFMVSALVVRLPQIGFQFTPSQLFWLAAMPGLAGGSLRLIHMFMTPMFGTRHVVALSTLSLLIPLVGSASRVLAGPLSDRLGGARVTHWAGIGMMVCAVLVALTTNPTSLDSFGLFVTAMLALFFFAGVGNASTFKQMPMLFEPRQAGGVIGFTAAIAAYGPFFFGMLFAWSFASFGAATPIFYGIAVFFAFNGALNWWMYARRNAVSPC